MGYTDLEPSEADLPPVEIEPEPHAAPTTFASLHAPLIELILSFLSSTDLARAGQVDVACRDALPQAGVSAWRPWGGSQPPRGEDETPRARGKVVEEFEAEAAEEHFERQRVEGGAF